MPVPIIVITGLALGLRLLMGGYYEIKPSLFIAIVSAMAVGLFLFCLKRDIRSTVGMRMMVIAVCMPLLAWSLPSLWMLFVLMCLWVPLAAGRFNMIVPVYLFSLLLLPGLDENLMIGSLKLVKFGVHDALALGAAAAIFWNPAKGKCRIEWDAVAFGVVFVLAIALARGTSASHHVRALIDISLDLALPYYIASRGLRSQEDLRSAMLWLGAGGLLVGAILAFELLKGWPVYNVLYSAYGLDTLLLVKLRGGMLRAGGPFVESTSAAMLVAICTVALYLSGEYFRTRWHHFLVLAAAIVGLLAPQSRGAWIGLCIAIAFADMARARYASLATKVLVLGGALSSLFLAAHLSPILSEALGLSGNSRDTSDYRRLLLERGLEEFGRNPLLGLPMSEVELRLPDLIQGEGIIDFVNTYIWIMLVSGIVGLFVFVGAFLYFLTKIVHVGRLSHRNSPDAIAGVFAFSVMAMLMEMFFFTSFATRPAIYTFAIFGFSAAFIRLRLQDVRIKRAVEGVLAGIYGSRAPV